MSTYTRRTMLNLTELEIENGVLSVNGEVLHGALTWIWDEITKGDFGLDPNPDGSTSAGMDRRLEEAQIVQRFRRKNND